MRTEGVERGVKRARFYAPPPDNYTLLVLLEQVERRTLCLPVIVYLEQRFSFS